MKKAIRTSVVATAASVALIAVGASPAFATTKPPTYAQYMANALHIKTVPSSALNLGGSSFDANLLNATIAQYRGLSGNNNNSLNAYSSTSSGTGRSGVISGSLNIGFSDVPLNFAGQDTTDTTAYAQVPVALGGVGLIYNINFKTTDTVTNSFGSATTTGLTCNAIEAAHHIALDGTTIGEIFAGNISSWTNANIVAQNPKLVVKVETPTAAAKAAVGTPGTKGYKAAVPQKNALKAVSCLSNALMTQPSITVESRTAGSGTTFMFRDYLSKADAASYPYPSSAAFGAATSTFSNSAGLAAAVSNIDGAVGYVEYGYAVQNGLETMRVKGAAGTVVSLNAKSVTSAATNGLAAINADNSGCPVGFSLDAPSTYVAANVNTQCFSITDVNNATAYPIAGFSYGIAKKAQSDDATAVAVAKFLEFLSQSGAGVSADTTFGQNLAGSQYYVALPKSIQAVAFSTIEKILQSDGTTSAVSATA